MADYPCDVHHERYRGPSTRVFVNIYRDDMEMALRLGVCEKCLDLVLGEWFTQATYRSEEGYWDPMDPDTSLDGLWRRQEGRQAPRNGRVHR